MTNPATATATPKPRARTHAQASVLLRRPFAPGAIGFRAMTKVPLSGSAYGGAAIAAFLSAQSVTQRLNAVCPGAWRMDFAPVAAELIPANAKKRYLACRLTITLPGEGGVPLDAVYTDVGETDSGSFAGLKALYSDARKRAAVTAGIGAYLYTALAPVILPIGPNHRQVQAIRRQGKPDLLALSPETEQWLRHGYEARMNTDAVRRDLGDVLGHGEPEAGMGQGEAADTATDSDPAVATDLGTMPAAQTPGDVQLVPVDFAAIGPNGSSGPTAA